MEKSALIVGCGYLGNRVADAWLASGRRVYATTRRPARAEELARRGIEPVICDVVDPSSLQSLPAVEEVLYCVGLDRSAGHSMHRVYVEGLAAVLQALPGRPRLVYVSSTSVYGQTDGSEVDENSATEPIEDSGKIVLQAEQVLRTHRPDAIVLRFAGIYGPGRLLRSRDLLAGSPLAIDPDKWLNLIHVEDGATAVQAALERASSTLYNVCDDHPVRRRDFYTRLAELLGAAPPNFVPVPQPLPVSERSNRRISNRRLRQELGVSLRYPSYTEGLAASYRQPL